ncbi:MAG: succinate dehydrogenase, hydrophobic membrane anchor protein [Candidatus Marinimicrobia bacterium]|nr:succinate dehydrogenase, hydrophobic membrane anchor protein [Candidatus Neomarinimicrobiota bacterium]
MKHNRERIRWVFQRISGLQLLICLGVHIWVFFFKLERPITLSGLSELFSKPEWVIFYTLFISLAVYHAFIGLWTILTDKNPSKTYKKVWKIILISGGTFIVGLSLWNLVLLGAV